MKFTIESPEIVDVILNDHSYKIYIGAGILTEIDKYLTEFDASKYIIITDDTVYELLGIDLIKQLEESKFNASIISIPSGESQKNLQTIEYLAKELIKLEADRKSLLIALGGGVIGDIVGFLASIYMRGIPYIQIPTTLLAQVDSSVGGKTGVDLAEGKNLLGTFYQPKAVFIDVGVLSTLPKIQLLNGIAEVIKYSIIKEPKLFTILEKYKNEILSFNPDILKEIIKISCQIKANIVMEDEKESNIRRILNFGHTFGHAIETLSNYTIPHGLAVSIGMNIISTLSEKLNLVNSNTKKRLQNLLISYNLPTTIPKEIDTKKIKNQIKSDKKAIKGNIYFVLMRDIGDVIISSDVPEEIIDETLKLCMEN